MSPPLRPTAIGQQISRLSLISFWIHIRLQGENKQYLRIIWRIAEAGEVFGKHGTPRGKNWCEVGQLPAQSHLNVSQKCFISVSEICKLELLSPVNSRHGGRSRVPGTGLTSTTGCHWKILMNMGSFSIEHIFKTTHHFQSFLYSPALPRHYCLPSKETTWHSSTSLKTQWNKDQTKGSWIMRLFDSLCLALWLHQLLLHHYWHFLGPLPPSLNNI